MTSFRRSLLLSLAVAASLLPAAARAHCDTLDGPVVTAAREALGSGELSPVLAWVRPADEAEVRAAFASARAVRAGGKEARALADRWFFETVVRVHRAGEGAPYTGLAPAGGGVEPAVAATDRLVARADPKALEALEGLLVGAVRHGLHERVARLRAERPPRQDVAAGRRFVAAYVSLVHWAEGVHAAASSAGEHAADAGGHAGHAAAPAGHAGHEAEQHEPERGGAADRAAHR